MYVTTAKCLSVNKWIKKRWRIYSAMRKREILPFVNNIDEPWGHYAKWSKSVRERQILNGITALWYQRRKAKLKETEGWVVVAGDWRVKETGSSHRVQPQGAHFQLQDGWVLGNLKYRILILGSNSVITSKLLRE